MAGIAVFKARYGIRENPQQQIDVTAQVQQLCNRDRSADATIEFDVDHNTLNIQDPAPDQCKHLSIEYFTAAGGRLLVREGFDGDRIMLKNGLIPLITGANYGSRENSIDLTLQLQSYFSDPGAPKLRVGSHNFHIQLGNRDLEPNNTKALVIRQNYQNRSHHLIALDGHYIHCQFDPDSHSARLVVSQ